MSEDVPWFRDLYNEVVGHQSDDLFNSVLRPWLERAISATNDFACFRSASEYDQHCEEFQLKIWNLYALSRVNDLLLLGFQFDGGDEWSGPRISPEQYAGFFEGLGLTTFECGKFASIHHEVFSVEESREPDQPIVVKKSVWPGLKFGEMVFSRAGVVVTGGSSYINKVVAESSTLYFAHRRLNRKTEDLSMGWGSNSQWRTSFRRDYTVHRQHIFNIDGENRLNVAEETENDRDGLTNSERIELCKNRCFISVRKSSADLWPYDDRYEEIA